MITHIVLWTVADKADIPMLRKALESLPANVPGIQKLVVGTPDNATPPMADISLYTEFASWDDLATYRTHPEHVKVGELIGQHVTSRCVSDYETE